MSTLWQCPTAKYQYDSVTSINPDVNNDGYSDLSHIIEIVSLFNQIGAVDLNGPPYLLALPNPSNGMPYCDVDGDNKFDIIEIFLTLGYFTQFGAGPYP